MYVREHETPPRDHVVDKTMLWGGIQMNTLMDDSTEKLADMMIQGNTKGIDRADEGGEGVTGVPHEGILRDRAGTRRTLRRKISRN